MLRCAAGSWSSPAFFKFHGVGGGLTLGVSRADTVIVLNSDRALAQYQSADFNFKFGELLHVLFTALPDQAHFVVRALPKYNL